MTLTHVLAFTLLVAAPGGERCAERIAGTDAYRELDSRFPGAVTIREGSCNAIEFCPENTCDAFYAATADSAEGLMEYAYLYLYWFSDYLVLEGWRASSDARRVMVRMLDAPRNAGCRRPDEKEAARCVLRTLAAKRGIHVAVVRYDEGTRSETRTPSP
jgi:hypothetical protein